MWLCVFVQTHSAAQAHREVSELGCGQADDSEVRGAGRADLYAGVITRDHGIEPGRPRQEDREELGEVQGGHQRVGFPGAGG